MQRVNNESEIEKDKCNHSLSRYPAGNQVVGQRGRFPFFAERSPDARGDEAASHVIINQSWPASGAKNRQP